MRIIVRERQSKINQELYFFENVKYVEIKFPYIVIYDEDYKPSKHCFRLNQNEFIFIP